MFYKHFQNIQCPETAYHLSLKKNVVVVKIVFHYVKALLEKIHPNTINTLETLIEKTAGNIEPPTPLGLAYTWNCPNRVTFLKISYCWFTFDQNFANQYIKIQQ